MAQNEFVEPLRRTQSAHTTRPHSDQYSLQSHSARNLSPLRAPTLMLVNGKGEISSLPSPIIGGISDDDSSSSDTETPVQETIRHVNSLLIPSKYESPIKSNQTRTKDYSPSMSPTKPPPSPPKRSLSPPKMILSTVEGKPRPVHSFKEIFDIESPKRASP
jgi:hypothetical protein